MRSESDNVEEKFRETHHRHLLASIFTEGFSPLHFPWISLSIEISVTFRSAKFKRLGIITDKCNTVSWINRTRAKVTCAYSHTAAIKSISRIFFRFQWCHNARCLQLGSGG